jgi:hypothetical protein
VEQTLRRKERTWIARLVMKSCPDLVETETDYLLTIGSSQPGFLVLTSPGALAIADPGQVTTLAVQAKREQRMVFQIGRAIVLAFNGAWDVPVLVEDLVTLLVRHQLGGPVPTLLPRSRLSRGFRALRAWVRGAVAALNDDGPVGTPASVPIPAGSGTNEDRASQAPTSDPVMVSLPRVGDTDSA